jgi:hypothetical protein
MDDEEVITFLTLKFSGLDNIVAAFTAAIGFVSYQGPPKQIATEKVLALWAEQGAPTTLEITEENALLMLHFKFGNIKEAYNFWISNPHNHSLSKYELQLVMDYVEPPRS